MGSELVGHSTSPDPITRGLVRRGTRIDTMLMDATTGAGMGVALECLAEARHKRPHVAHIIMAPWLMTHMWRKQIGKDADLLFTVPVGVPFWGKHQHEPLIVCLLLPVVKRRNWRGPWIIRGSSFASTPEDELRRIFDLSVGKKPKQCDE